jgi:acetyl esterase
MTAPSPYGPLAERFPELDATYARLLDAARVSGLPPIHGLAPEALRERVRAGDSLCAPGPEMLDIADDRLGQLTIRRYIPRRLDSDRVLVWFHGGGWVSGDIGYSEQFCRMLADGISCEVRSVDYRLAPEHPFPAAVDDALTAVRWAASGGREVVVAGDSAGGNLAAVAAQELAAKPSVRLVGQLLVYPVLDTDRSQPSYLRYDGLVIGVAEMGWFFAHYLPREPDRASLRAAPLRAAGLGGLPPTVVAVSGLDPLYDEGIAYAQRMAASGVPVTLLEFPSLPHGFLRFTGPVPAAAGAAARIVAATAAMAGLRAAAAHAGNQTAGGDSDTHRDRTVL